MLEIRNIIGEPIPCPECNTILFDLKLDPCKLLDWKTKTWIDIYRTMCFNCDYLFYIKNL